MASAFLGKYASITAVNLIQRKKLNFWNLYESNLTEARFEILILYRSIHGSLLMMFDLLKAILVRCLS